MMKRRNRMTIAGALLLVSLAGCMNGGNNNNDSGERVRLVPVETMSVERGSFDDFIRITGVVEALEDATISSESSGRIQTILNRGDTVRQGGVIAKMDDRLSRAQFEAARTSFDLAEDTYHRLQALYEDEIISTQDFRAARAQRDQARAQLDQAEKQLQDTDIQAPFNGRIEERFVRQGELINPGMPVVRLVNIEAVRVTAGIPERYSGQISEGAPAFVRIRALEEEEIESRVSFAGQVIDSATRTFPIEVELSNTDGRIKPEMIVNLRVKRIDFDNVVIIPRTAVVRDERTVHVFRVAEESGERVAELVEIRTGFTSGPFVEVTEGLQSGDEIIVAGLSTLNMGDRLNTLSTSTTIEKVRELRSRDRTSAR